MEISCSIVNQMFVGVTASVPAALSLFGQSRALLEFNFVCGLAVKTKQHTFVSESAWLLVIEELNCKGPEAGRCLGSWCNKDVLPLLDLLQAVLQDDFSRSCCFQDLA